MFLVTLMHDASQYLRNLKTTPKLMGSFLLVCIIMTIIGGAGILAVSKTNTITTSIVRDNVPSIQQLSAVQSTFQLTQTDFRDAVLDPNTSNSDAFLAQVKTDEQNLNDQYAMYQNMPHTGTTMVQIRLLTLSLRRWGNTLHAMESAAVEHTPDSNFRVTLQIVYQWGPQKAAVLDNFSTLIAQSGHEADVLRMEADNTYHQMLWIIGIVLFIAFAIAVGLGLLLSRLIANPMQQMVQIALAVAGGNLTPLSEETLRLSSKDEVGQLTVAFGHMIDGLRQLISGINTVSQGMNTISGQIVFGANQTNQGIAQVANTIQHVTVGAQDQHVQLDKATSEIAFLADQSKDVFSNSQSTMNAMAALEQSVEATSQSLQHLGTQSTQINVMVEGITEIAKQTNLLALNAAIEAARAGTQGKGFAVVASEVRKLAERSAHSAKEIEQIVHETLVVTEQTIAAINIGKSQVKDTIAWATTTQQQSQAMVDSTERVNQTMAVIASISQENYAATEKVTASTQEMATHTHEALTATQQLGVFADQLHTSMLAFTLDSAAKPDPRSITKPTVTTAIENQKGLRAA